jgi:hypothetical protein
MALGRNVFEVSARIRMGADAGLTLRNVGSAGRSPGRSLSAALIAAWTSRAAPSILRLRSNCTVIVAEPSEFDDVSSVTPGISPSRRSSGAETVAAMVIGSAPGRLADTLIVGKSTVGRLATGKNSYAVAPARNRPMASRVVATGRKMNNAETFTRSLRDALDGVRG